MIRVIANPADSALVAELFELFKTPWRPYQPGEECEVLLCFGDQEFDPSKAKVVIAYAGHRLPIDRELSETGRSSAGPHNYWWRGALFALYGPSITFSSRADGLPVDGDSGLTVVQVRSSEGRVLARVGYDLLDELRFLLTEGQPPVNAAAPTLELHIALLRELILSSGAGLVEIPPVPEGHKFIACLTHDVDHPSLRRHGFDLTILGFLLRASVGSLVGLFRGRTSWQSSLSNWMAVLKLPLVHLGLARDFWLDFDRYVALEGGASSSFFVIPFSDRRGRRASGEAPPLRAARYGAADIAAQLQRLSSAGCEIAVHGIDAWTDSAAAQAEAAEIRQISGKRAPGIRMHWLYFDANSPARLEKAGFDYDSTVGYNETVGFRAGTTQAFKPLNAKRMLELPMHVMDTALFYPGYLNLSQKDGVERARQIIRQAMHFGGAVTLNWHDRSIAPERLWDKAYSEVLREMRSGGAWMANAGQTVCWFRKRRETIFAQQDGKIYVELNDSFGDEIPALVMRTYPPAPMRTLHDNQQDWSSIDVPITSFCKVPVVPASSVPKLPSTTWMHPR